MTVEAMGDGIWKLTADKPSPGAVHAYVIRRDHVTMVDCGHVREESQEVLRRGLQEIGLRPSDVDQIVLTHSHFDHCGGLIGSQPTFSCRTIGYQGMQGVGERLQQHAHDARHYPERLVRRFPEFDALLRPNPVLAALRHYFTLEGTLRVDREVSDGESIDIGSGETLRVIATPGHGIDHMCLYHEPSAILFGGDIILNHGPAIPSLKAQDIDDSLASLRRLQELDVNQILSGHGPVLEDPIHDLERSIRQIEADRDRIREVITAGARTPLEVVRQATQRSVHMLQIWKIGTALTHLEHLADSNEIAFLEDESGRVRSFEAAAASATS
jgi:glyoxylase-like metal-dependent hydrolase (beta-lactamase superfamily II)